MKIHEKWNWNIPQELEWIQKKRDSMGNSIRFTSDCIENYVKEDNCDNDNDDKALSAVSYPRNEEMNPV